MSVIGSNILAGASGGASAEFKIERSLRFNSADSAYLNRTPSSAGNRRTWTWSGWVKKSGGSGFEPFFSAGDSTWLDIAFNSDKLRCVFNAGAGEIGAISDAVFRDFSSWYHIVVAVDTTQSTAADRIKFYVNGASISHVAGSDGYPSQNYNTLVNSATIHRFGADGNNTIRYGSNYLAEVHFIDGQALAASDFGEYDSNSVWQPKNFADSHNAAASGTVYSSQTITNESSSYPTENMFDGVYGSSASTNNSVIANEIDGTYSVYTFASPISYSSSVRIYGDLDTRSTNNPDIKANSTSVTGVTDNTARNGSNKKWYTVLSGSGTLSTVSLNQYDGYLATIFAIEVDGTVLVDGTLAGVNGFHLDFSDNSNKDALGTDSSGNSNTWTVNNIASGTDTDYTKDIDLTNGDPVRSTNDIYDIFDGNTSTGAETDNGDGNSLLFDFANGSGSIPVSTNIEVWVGGSGSRTLKVNGNTIATNTGTGNNPHTITGQSQLNSVEVVSESATRSGFLLQISVDGSALVSDNPVTVDSLIDTPTNYEADSGNNGGNYATLNPISAVTGAGTPSNGNLDWSDGNNISTIQIPSSGKWYAEQTITGLGSDILYGASFGVRNYDISRYARLRTAANIGQTAGLGTANTPSYSQLSVGDVIAIAVDSDGGSITFYVNNSSVYQITSITDISGLFFYTAFASSGDAGSWNFGQRPFQYPPGGTGGPPSDYKSLCTQNLDDPTIENPSDYFDVALDTGANILSSTKALCNNGADFLWIKDRNNSNTNHHLIDIVRDSQLDGTPFLSSNSPSDETTLGTYSAPSGNSVGWAWDAGTSNTPISAGGLNSSVYDQSQNWTNLVTFNAGTWNGNGTAPFDDDPANSDYGDTDRANNGYATLDISSLTGSRVISVTSEQTEVTITHDGGTTTYTPSTTSRITHTFAAVNNPTSIKFNGLNSNSVFVLVGVSVDGKRLINSNITPTNVPTIPTTYRANASAGFSIVSYTADATSSQTIGHGLNAKPGLIIVKDRDVSSHWSVYHQSLNITGGEYLKLSDPGAVFTSNSQYNSTEAGTSVFTVGSGGNTNYQTGNEYIAYCFAPVAGYSAFGSYTGNGSSTGDGPFVYTGMRPRYVWLKRTDASGSWLVFDTARSLYNLTADYLKFDAGSQEANDGGGAGAWHIDILSNGFKVRSDGNAGQVNAASGTWVWGAFAEHPFKTARAR